MLGRYENFPEMYHGIIRFRYQVPTKKLQEIVLHVLYELNNEGKGFNLPSIHAVSDCKVNFDFGIADGMTFSYLEKETLTACSEIVQKDELPVLDFICIVRYYKKDGRDRRPLKFDYYLLRFLFYDETVEFQIFHERGTRRLSIEDLLKIIFNRFEKELTENELPKITVEHMRTL